MRSILHSISMMLVLFTSKAQAITTDVSSVIGKSLSSATQVPATQEHASLSQEVFYVLLVFVGLIITVVIRLLRGNNGLDTKDETLEQSPTEKLVERLKLEQMVRKNPGLQNTTTKVPPTKKTYTPPWLRDN